VRDWVAWHSEYDDPQSHLRRRLDRVCFHLGRAIDSAPAGPVRLVSLCAGQGRDVIGVLPGHPRRAEVTAVLIESDHRNAGQARSDATAAGLSRLEVRQADASLAGSFADILPADVMLLCGIFGNVSDADIERTVTAAPAMCSAGASVIWTRHRRSPDLTPRIRAWFAASGFDEVAFDALDTATLTGVGVHRLRQPSATPIPTEPLFTFRAS
jgi:hypothetical protein